jgi:hypothetical protein
MSEGQEKKFVDKVLENPALVVLASGAFFLLIGVTGHLKYKEGELAIEAGLFQYISIGIGTIFMLVGVAMVWLKTFKTEVARELEKHCGEGARGGQGCESYRYIAVFISEVLG